MNIEYILWRIKHWIKYQPSIYFCEFMSRFFHILAEINDRIGYLLFGKKRWEELKKEQGIED